MVGSMDIEEEEDIRRVAEEENGQLVMWSDLERFSQAEENWQERGIRGPDAGGSFPQGPARIKY